MSSVLEVPIQLALAMALAMAPDDTRQHLPGVLAAAARSSALVYNDSDWVRAVEAHGAAAGQARLARRIFRTSAGRIYVPVEQDRAHILALRADTAVVLRIASEAARANAKALAHRLGREPSLSELYMVHTLGVDVAHALLGAATHEPARRAAEIAPQAALAHPEIFFQQGKLRTVMQVIAALDEAFGTAARRAAGLPGLAGASARVPAHATAGTRTIR